MAESPGARDRQRDTAARRGHSRRPNAAVPGRGDGGLGQSATWGCGETRVRTGAAALVFTRGVTIP